MNNSLEIEWWKGIDEYIFDRPNNVGFCVCILKRTLCDRHYFFSSFSLSKGVFGRTGKTFFAVFRVFMILTHVASIRAISSDKLAHYVSNLCSVTCFSRQVWSCTCSLQSVEVTSAYSWRFRADTLNSSTKIIWNLVK